MLYEGRLFLSIGTSTSTIQFLPTGTGRTPSNYFTPTLLYGTFLLHTTVGTSTGTSRYSMYVPVLYVDDPAVELLNNEDCCARAQLTNNGTCNVGRLRATDLLTIDIVL